MRILLTTALAAFTAASIHAQCTTPCQVDFDGPTHQDNVSMGNVFLGIKTVALSDLVVLRVEVFTGERTGDAAVMIWNHDATGNKPGTSQASGSFVTAAPKDWQGANLDKPVVIPKGTTFWVVWDTVGGEQGSIQGNGPGAQQYRGSFDQGRSWNGPFQSYQWKFRLYCCQKQPALYTTYGRACPGTNRTLPTTGSVGKPVLGQSYQITLSRAAPAAPAFFALGGSDQKYLGLTLPFDLTTLGAPSCFVLCSYDVLLGTTTSNTGAAAQAIAVPNDPSLLAKELFNQWIVRDAANNLQLVFSDGGKSTLGR